MGLTNKQFEQIMHQYDAKKNYHKDLLSSHEREIRQELPMYYQLREKLNGLRIKRLDASISGNENLVLQCEKEENEIKKQCEQLLIDNGYSNDYLSMSYDCPICKDTGFMPGTGNKCSCFIQAQTKLIFEQSGIYDLIKEQNFDTLSFEYFDDKESANYKNAITVAKNFIANFNSDYHNLLFYGNVGTGKTFLSCCIAKELMEKGVSVTYCSADQLFRSLIDLRFQEDKDSYFSFMEDIFERDLLIIDDLGTEHVTERIKSDLFTCINNRDIAQKATIISTNLSLEELNARYSERVFSRISSHFSFCKFEGRDIRILKKFQNN